MAVKSHSCPSWRLKRLSLVGQIGFLVSGNVDFVTMEEIQQFRDFAADTVRVHCISRRQLVCVGADYGPGFISISTAH